MGIDIEVYDSAGTPIAAPTKSFGRGWRDEWNEVGSGQWSIARTDAALVANPTMKRYGNIARMKLDGDTVFSVLTEARKLPPAPEGENAERVWTFSGRATLALMEDATVYPEIWFPGSTVRNRYFGWMSASFDDSSWISATQIQRQDASSPVVAWKGFPRGWREHTAYWIWSRALSGGSMPVGTSYFRKSFTLSSSTYLTFIASCDNQFRLWLDGELIMDYVDPIPDWRDMKAFSRILPAGTHQLAAQCMNASGGGANPAGFICAVYTLTTAGAINSVYLHTDNTWKALDYPTTEPGMNTGEILTTLFAEGQARGCYVGVGLGFDASVDSLGAAWPASAPRNWPIGTTVLDVIRSMISQDVDVRMDFLTLDVYQKGTFRSDLSGSISLAVGQDFASLTADGQAHLVNAVLLRDQTGALHEGASTSSLTTNRRKEGYVEVGTAADATQALVVANGVFTGYSEASAQMDGRVPQFVKNPTTGATDVPTGFYTTWQTGDTITMPANDDGVTAPMKVLALTISEDQSGNVFAQIEGMEDDG